MTSGAAQYCLAGRMWPVGSRLESPDINNENTIRRLRVQYVRYFHTEYSIFYLEVNKCAFTFSSEIIQIQCTRTEFWCVQCPRPAGPSALDKHQIQASALALSYFTRKSKYKFVNLIHTRQKNKIICSCSWKIINKIASKCHLTWRILRTLPSEKKNGSIDVTLMHAITHQNHLVQSGRSTRSVVDIFNTPCVYTKELSENKKLSWSVWMWSGTLRGYCTPGPYFWRLCAFSQKIKQLRTKYPMDLVRNVPRNSKITVLLQ